MSKPECALCETGTIGEEWSRDLLDGKRKLVEAADRFDISVDQVWNHVMQHSASVEPLDVQSKLQKFLRLAEDWLHEVILKEPPSAKSIKPVVALMAEIRKLLILSAELQGELKPPETQVIQYNQMLTVVVGELCPTCQQKVLGLLERGGGDFHD